ncbi:unnamed protein product [Ambrosiozyma monospora]|uniref:Unnamed protein product n=1 Tax=Ambrosiozyma monospora TaxID=43982 RepID=A0ACB5SRE8_AMBMO|nr:unnamed protein product [Ambrosiozyma monospora]
MWAPLPKILCGKVIKPFTPFLDHPTLSSSKKASRNLRNMYPGDLVYIFEAFSSSKKWVRGYLLSQLNPSDFSLASVSSDVIQENKVTVVVFPLANIEVMREIDVTAADDHVEAVIQDNGDVGYTYNGTETDVPDSYSLMSSSTSSSDAAKKTTRPALPVNDYAMSIDSLIGEIEAALRGLNIQLFAMYTRGDFKFFKKMVEVFDELEEIKLGFQYGLLTKDEVNKSKKKTAYLMTLMSKIIAAGTGKKSVKDVAGYESILARDEITGELFTLEKDNFEKSITDVTRLAQNQLFGALASQFPVANSDITTIPELNQQFAQSYPSHVLIDFKQFSGRSHNVPDGYLGFDAYVYLRNSKKRLTEAFAIHVGPNNDIMVDNLPSALFKNIPESEIHSGRIYLAALIIENVQVKVADPANGVPNLQTIRKGMCAGVVDISKIFNSDKNHLSSGELHKFSMKLYSSYMTTESHTDAFRLYPGINPLLAMSMTMDNNGWGEVIDRIISGSNKGIAVNPRLEGLTLSIKEIKNDGFSVNAHSVRGAVEVIKPLFYDPMESDYDRIYLRVVRPIDIVGARRPSTFVPNGRNKIPDFITVEVRSSSKQLMFAKGSNETVQNRWHFVSTAVGEHIEEIVQITGLSADPSEENDYLFFDVYVNGVFHGEGRYPLRVYNKILDTELNSKRPKKVEIFSQNSTAAVGCVEISLEYVGKHYNIDSYVELLLNWKSAYDQSKTNPENTLITALKKVRQTGVLTAVKFFPQLMANLFDIYTFACEKHQILSVYGSIEESKFKPLADAAFGSIVHILDMVIFRQHTYIYLFDQLMESSLPKVGDFMIEEMLHIFDNFETTWNSTGRALCRVLPLMVQLSLETHTDKKLFFTCANKLMGETLGKFISVRNEALISEQLILMTNMELCLGTLRSLFGDLQIGQYVVIWSGGLGLKGVDAVDEVSTNALANKKRKMAHQTIITKLILYNRFSRYFLDGTTSSEARKLVVSCSLGAILDVIFSPKIDMDASRLGFGIILGVIETVFANEHKFTIPDNEEIRLIFCRMMPVLCDAFNRYYDYCKSHNMFKPRRTFTQLFPTAHPFEEHTIDFHVKDESFCECLIELTVLIIICNKITCTVENSIVASFTNSCAYTGNLCHVDRYIGLTSEYRVDSLSQEAQQRSDKNLSRICVKAYNEIVHPTYYPGSKWLSLKALANLSIAEVFNDAVDVAFIPPPEKADSFDNKFWESFFYCSLRTISSKVCSIEHLNAVATKACFNITGDIRPRLCESVYSAWHRMGFPVSEQIEKTFHVTRIGGLQKFMIEERNRIIRSGIFMMAMQRDPTCVNLAKKVSVLFMIFFSTMKVTFLLMLKL